MSDIAKEITINEPIKKHEALETEFLVPFFETEKSLRLGEWLSQGFNEGLNERD